MTYNWDHINANHFLSLKGKFLCTLTFSDEGMPLQNASTIQLISVTLDQVSSRPILKANSMIVGFDLDENQNLWAVDLNGNVFSNNQKLSFVANQIDKDPIYDCDLNWNYDRIIKGAPSCLKVFEGNIYIATFTGDIYKINKNGTFTVSKGKIHPFRFKKLNSLYLNTRTALLRLEKDGTWSHLNHISDNIESLMISDVAEWEGVSYAFGRDGKIFTIDGDVLNFKMQSHTPIFEVAKTPKGLVFVTGTEGIKLFNGTEVSDFQVGDFVGVTTIKEDTVFIPASTTRSWVVCYEHKSEEWSRWNI